MAQMLPISAQDSTSHADRCSVGMQCPSHSNSANRVTAGLQGRHARDYFNRNGELRHIKELKFWPLDKVLGEKYQLPAAEVRGTGLGWCALCVGGGEGGGHVALPGPLPGLLLYWPRPVCCACELASLAAHQSCCHAAAITLHGCMHQIGTHGTDQHSSPAHLSLPARPLTRSLT